MNRYEHLVVERDGPVGWLVFDRPESLNALNVGMEEELAGAWQELEADDDVHVIVNSGVGRAFQVGVDVKEVARSGSMIEHQRNKRHKREPTEHSRLTGLDWHVTKPVICAVNGLCAGAGFHFVTDADFVIAADDAEFLDPHVSVGQISALEPIALLPSLPFGVVMRMMLMGRGERLPARRLYDLGLVTELVPADQLRARGQAIGQAIARNSPSAIAVSKAAVWASLGKERAAAMADGMRSVAGFWDHPDGPEGAAAFAAKRPPQWAPRTLSGPAAGVLGEPVR